MLSAWRAAGGSYAESGSTERAMRSATATSERDVWEAEVQADSPDTAGAGPAVPGAPPHAPVWFLGAGLLASVLARGRQFAQQHGDRAEWWVKWAPVGHEPAWEDVAW